MIGKSKPPIRKEKNDEEQKNTSSDTRGSGSATAFCRTCSGERKTIGKDIIKHQAIAFKLADMATEIEAMRFLCLKAAWLKDNGKPYGTESAMAKLYCAEQAMKITTDAVQVLGGYGYMKDFNVERMFRDAKLTQIFEGTNQIQRLVIAREILKELP